LRAFFYVGIKADLEVNMLTTLYKDQGNGGVKVIKVEGGREKGKEVIVRHEKVYSKWKPWNQDNFSRTGTRIIQSKKYK